MRAILLSCAGYLIFYIRAHLSNIFFEPFCYELVICWSDKDQTFIAEVPELPGCAADGATYQEALANVEVIIQEWIEIAKELGRPIPKPKRP